MGSTMDSRYWTCPQCLNQFDWEDGSAQRHHPEQCKRDRAADKQWRKDVEKGRALALEKARQKMTAAGVKPLRLEDFPPWPEGVPEVSGKIGRRKGVA